MIPEEAVEAVGLPESWAEWHESRMARSKPLTYQEAQAAVALWKFGATLKDEA